MILVDLFIVAWFLIQATPLKGVVANLGLITKPETD